MSSKSPVIRWIISHDESLWFNVLYIGLALVLSIILGLFWLVAVVALHGVIEFLRQLLIGRSVVAGFAETFWELKLDIALIVFALWLGVYLDVIFGVAGLSAATRATAQAGGRLARTGSSVVVWQRVLRSVLISLDDVGLAMKAIARNKSQNANTRPPNSLDNNTIYSSSESDHAGNDIATPRTSWRGKYSKGDWLSLFFGGVFLSLILLTPLFTEMNMADVWKSVMNDLTPFS